MEENKNNQGKADSNSATKEAKSNKKIIIICSIVIAIIILGLIGWFISKAIDGDKKPVNNVSDQKNDITESIPSLDLDITLESKTTTEQETTKAGTTTEATEKETIAEIASTTEEETTAEETKTTEQPTERETKKDFTIIFHENVVVVNPTTEYVKPSLSELEWLRQKFGDTFTMDDGDTLVYSEKYNAYITKTYDCSIHKMISENTSQEMDYYYISIYNSVALANWYGYGKINPEEAFINKSICVDSNEQITKIDYDEFKQVREANSKLLQPILKSKSNFSDNNWNYMTIHGLPVEAPDWYGYIVMNVVYPGKTKPECCKFTIEEYYDFVNKYNWTIKEEKYNKIYFNGEFEVTDKYVIVQ